MAGSDYEELRGQGPAAFAADTGRRRYWDALDRQRAAFLDPDTGGLRAELGEHVACAACADDDPAPAFGKAGLEYVRCRTCGTLYTLPQLRDEAMMRFWERSEAAELWAEVLQHPAQVAYDRDKYDGLLDDLGEPDGDGRLLDIGCGTGLFLDRARARGWDVVGVEPGAASRRVAAQTYGLEVAASLDEVTGTFDVITSWEVVEHTKRPVEVLQAARRLSSPSGRLVSLIGGNGAALANRVMQARSAAFDFPRYWYFTPASYDRLLDRAGWVPDGQRPLLDEIDVVHRYLGYGDPYGEPILDEDVLPEHLLRQLREHALTSGMAYKFISLARA